MSADLGRICASHGVEPRYVGMDGREHTVVAETLARLAEAFGIDGPATGPPPTGIEEALALPEPATCYMPDGLRGARVWGITCQLPALVSARNLAMGDFADLAELCRIAAREGADFVGTNPLHALFWSAPDRVSPFFPSDRRFLNPLNIAAEWIEGSPQLRFGDAAEVEHLKSRALIDAPGVARLKRGLLRDMFGRYPWTAELETAFGAFRQRGGAALEAHAAFETISAAMAAEGHGAFWPAWPEPLQDAGSEEVAAIVERHRDELDFHVWLQWQAARQVARVQREAREAGMRVGLYLDLAVGAAPDGAATWSDPDLSVPGVSMGSPPDDFNTRGQDWGLVPLSPIKLDRRDMRPVAEILQAVVGPAGALRIDHAMSLARLWMIPRHMAATEGAYVRYPLTRLLDALAAISSEQQALIIGEDLGVVPQRFRALLASREIHSYKVFFFERRAAGFADPAEWPAGALACLATHDMPTFTGWWRDSDLALRRRLGLLSEESAAAERALRDGQRAEINAIAAHASEESEISARLHGHVAASPCRLAALQIEDALGVEAQVNLPGTIDEHPNWRWRLPVPLERFADHPGFRAHCAAMRAARPR